MELTVKQDKLLKALKIVGRLSSTRSSLAILSNTLLVAKDGEISLTSTDLEAAVSYKIPGKVTNSGSITFPTKLMLDLVANVGSGNIDVSVDQTKINIETASLKSTINGIAASEFPAIPVVSEGEKVSLQAGDVNKGISRVLSSSSKDDTRPVLNGVYMYTDADDKIVFVATDSYRLSEQVSNSTSSAKINTILPNQASQELATILEGEDELTVFFGENQVRFETPNASLVSKTTDGNYPDYKNLIPQQSDVSLTVNRQELLSAVKTAGLFARDIGGSIKFEAKEGVLSVKSTSTQIGENNSTVESDVSGEGVVSFNSRYMTEALSSVGGDSVSVGFSSNISPIIIKNNSDDEYTQLIMPLKT